MADIPMIGNISQHYNGLRFSNLSFVFNKRLQCQARHREEVIDFFLLSLVNLSLSSIVNLKNRNFKIIVQTDFNERQKKKIKNGREQFQQCNKINFSIKSSTSSNSSESMLSVS
ncbi:hypothetical protein BLOT_013045 [Blomia tropicalis]|nr:hypothetical protein BLOT_013045 [Blomia tropicalis]